MNPPADQPEPRYVTCSCQHCSGHIEFDACALEEGETRTVPCPHCELETLLSIPEQRVPPVIPPAPVSEETEEDSPDDYSLAFNWWRRGAEQGYPESQAMLGVLLLQGLGGIAQDHAQAAHWLLKAAEQGHATAQYNLALCYWTGHGVAKDHSEGAKWFRKGAEQGNVMAQYNLGACYWNGHGVSKDHSEGAKWFLKAAKQGDAGAQMALSGCYEQGDGVSQNLVEAYKWAKLAAAQNEDGAQKRSDELASKMSKDQMAEGQGEIEAFEIELKSLAKPRGGPHCLDHETQKLS